MTAVARELDYPDRSALDVLLDILTELQSGGGGGLTPADIAGLATAVKQDASKSVLDALLVELGPKLEAADLAALSTAAKQDAAKSVLDSILAALQAQADQTEAQPVSGPVTNAELRAAPIAVSDNGGSLTVDGTVAISGGALSLPSSADVFGAVVTGARDNQIEVHFDDTNWATYVTTSSSGGGGTSQHEGHVHFQTGTGTNGKSSAVALDVIKYRPMHEIYAAWTAAWPTPGVANSYQRIGYGDTAYVNGFFIGYENTQFGLSWFRNGIKTFIPQASWDDPCLGGVGSNFKRNGTPEVLNPAFTNVFRMRVGLLGSAQLIMETYSPDGEWVPIYTLKRPNTDSEPTFTNFDLPLAVDVSKSGAGGTALEIRTACWAGGTTSHGARLSDVITDRSLAQTTRAVIEGKTPSGSYAKVTVNSAGRLQVTNDSVGADGAAAPAGVTAVGGLGPGGLLQTLAVDASGNLALLPLPSGAATELTQQNRYGGGKTSVVATVTNAGDTVVHTPAVGKAIRLYWVSAINDPDESATPLVKVFVGATECYRAYAVAHWEIFEGAANETLKVNLSQAASVAFTAHIEEFTP